MILSNDQKHTFTAFGARAFMRKEETTTEGEEEEITSFFHARAAFLPFLYARTPAVTNFCWSFLKKEIFRRGSFCRFATFVSGLCNSSAFSSAFVPFAPSNFLISSEQQREKRIYYSITISQRRERKREKEKGEKLFAAFPSHRRKTSSTKQKRDREIERLRERKEISCINNVESCTH